MAWNTDNHGQHMSVAPNFMSKVFAWMFAALSVTAGVAVYFSPDVNPHLAKMMMQGPVFLIMLVQLGIAFYFARNVMRMSFSSGIALFLLYSALNGVMLSSIFAVYTLGSIAYTFGIAAAMFGVMALYGAITKTDLSGMSSILFMGLIGLIIAGIVNMFVQSQVFHLGIAVIGVGIFALLTAYDIQKLKDLGARMIASNEDVNKVALFGALQLYLDFINLFLYLLRIFGNRKD